MNARRRDVVEAAEASSSFAHTLVSVDSHILEPAELWAERIDKSYRERAPRVVSEEEGDQWYADGSVPLGRMGTVGAAGVRFEDPGRLNVRGRLHDLPAGGSDPHARIADMDRDGVLVDVLYPSATLHAYRIQDSSLVTAIFRAYNDWLADFCGAVPQRLKGIALLNVDDVRGAVAELERAARMGLIGAVIPVEPAWADYSRQEYALLWDAAQALEMPLSFHVGTMRWHPGCATLVEQTLALLPLVNRDLEIRTPLAMMIMSGVFERHPKLRVVSLEYESSWVPHFLYRMDNCYTERYQGLRGYRFKTTALPSDFFRAHVSISFQEDPWSARDHQIIGPNQLMWGSDYPHAESTFPRSRQILQGLLGELEPQVQAGIASLNAARLYRIDLPAPHGR